MPAYSSNEIVPCLWFDDQAEEAANFYISLFDNSEMNSVAHYNGEGEEIHGQPEGKVMTVDFKLADQSFLGLNGGPHFEFTTAVSFFVVCETEEEVDQLWNELLEGGSALMPLQEYNWSKKYGWVQDKYGLSWQLSLGRMEDVGQKITPSFMYVSEDGQAEQAIELYTSLFEETNIVGIQHYEAGEEQPEGSVKHAQFSLGDQVFMAMDSSPEHAKFSFNEALSFQILCDTQEQVDFYWDELSRNGEESQCGWLKDPFGVSWQIVPTILPKIMNGDDTEKAKRATKAMLQMQKLDIATIEAA
ncbi:MAG: VOC family protein [Balneolaceae bacterium]|nr:VOC family protein [Balneolaceae bacterium]